MKFAVAGLGYIGQSNTALLDQNHEVPAVDVTAERVAAINANRCSIVDPEPEDFLSNKPFELTAPLTSEEAYTEADIVIVAIPTNYDP